jgi:hypothetical protein
VETVSTSSNSVPFALKALLGLAVAGLVAVFIWVIVSFVTNPNNVWYAGMDRAGAGEEISKVLAKDYPGESTGLVLVSRSHGNYAGREAWRFVFRRPHGDGHLCGFAWSSYEDTNARIGPC